MKFGRYSVLTRKLLSLLCLVLWADHLSAADNLSEQMVSGFWKDIQTLSFTAQVSMSNVTDGIEKPYATEEKKIFYEGDKFAFYQKYIPSDPNKAQGQIASTFNGKEYYSLILPGRQVAKISSVKIRRGNLFYFENPISVLQFAGCCPREGFYLYDTITLKEFHEGLRFPQLAVPFSVSHVASAQFGDCVKLSFDKIQDAGLLKSKLNIRVASASFLSNVGLPVEVIMKGADGTSTDVLKCTKLGTFGSGEKSKVVFPVEFEYHLGIPSKSPQATEIHRWKINDLQFNKDIPDSIFTFDPREYGVYDVSTDSGESFQLPALGK